MELHKKRVAILVLLSIFSLLVSCPAYGQGLGEAKVYKAQFIELHAKVQTIFARIEEQDRRGSDPKSIQRFREELLALQTLDHRLGEEAARSNMGVLESGRDSNKTLLLVAQGCEGLSFVFVALDNYLETKDRAFLGFAKDGEEIVKSVQKVL